jgi:hypothetical protein
MNDTVRKPGKPKGAPKSGGGSRKGVPNKSTANAREAIARFVDGNSDRLQGWLDDIALDEKQGPKAALDAFMGLLEYHVPKLARTEHVGDGGGPVIVQAGPLDERL